MKYFVHWDADVPPTTLEFDDDDAAREAVLRLEADKGMSATVVFTEAGRGNHHAPAGQVWVCAACGKQSRDRYGKDPVDPGWDSSCMLHAVLCHAQPSGQERWTAVDDQPGQLRLRK